MSVAAPSKVAVVGLGYFSQFHLRSWEANPDVDLLAICDPNPEALQAAQQRCNAQAFTDIDSLLQQTDAEIIDIVAPPVAHADLISRMIRSGRLIICQKPFCTSIEQAQQIVQLAAEGNTTVVIHENFRFQPWHRTLKGFLDSGKLGQIYQCRFNLRPGDGRGADAYLARQPFFQQMPRLLIHETAVHFIDLFRWLLGDIQSVYADLRKLNPVIAGEDAGILVLEHEGGAVSVFDGNRLSDHVADNTRLTMGELLLEGEGGALRLNGHGQLYFRAFGAREESPLPIELAVDESSFGGGCVDYLNRSALDAYRENGDYENTAESYLDVMRVSEAAYESHSSNRKIDLRGTAR